MFNPAQAKEDNDRINNLLMKEPEYEQVKQRIDEIAVRQISINSRNEQVKYLQGCNQDDQKEIDSCKNLIKEALLTLESNTGFSKCPGLAHLMTVPSKFEVKDADAVPAEFVKTKMTSSVDKVKLNKAIATGQIDTNVNWLEVIPAYKTVVIE